MEKFYDKRHNRLVFIKDRADQDFWDSHWEQYSLNQTVRPMIMARPVTVPTKKYLPRGARILEGGCGMAQNVWALRQAGYDVHGVDYAEKTVDKIKQYLPELNISYGDVRNLSFDDDFFDGYWSLGVIEHFYNGFLPIAFEMKRVIKSGGFLFLTFPCISIQRDRKINNGAYRMWNESDELIDRFYQFALSPKRVENQFASIGFKLVEQKSTAGFKGFKDEVESDWVQNIMQKIYDSRNLGLKAVSWVLGQILSPWAGHMQLMVFKKTG